MFYGNHQQLLITFPCHKRRARKEFLSSRNHSQVATKLMYVNWSWGVNDHEFVNSLHCRITSSLSCDIQTIYFVIELNYNQFKWRLMKFGIKRGSQRWSVHSMHFYDSTARATIITQLNRKMFISKSRCLFFQLVMQLREKTLSENFTRSENWWEE